MDVENYLAQIREELDKTISSATDSRISTSSTRPEEVVESGGYVFCPECGSSFTNNERFCSNCGTCLADNDADDFPLSDIEDPDVQEHPLTGIIFTDTECMAKKYGRQAADVEILINEYIKESEEANLNWIFLDIAAYRSMLKGNEWQEYNRIINIFCKEKSIKTGPNLSLFIIGGNDVIPIPFLNNPYFGEDIPCDMAYSYEDDYLTEIVSSRKKPKLDMCKVRCTVARLPLQDGFLEEDDLYDDIQSYFNKSGIYAKEGIPVETVLMTTHKEWLPASATMSEHLPLQAIDTQSEYVKDGMFVSPELTTSNEDSLEDYIPSLKESDMLMFNLHGSNFPRNAGFYSDYEVFNPEMLSYSPARVLNTVACYGARYQKFERDESMLLSALYSTGILLYTGAMVSVPMLEYNEARELLLNPGSGSEVFMRLYSLYLFKGIPSAKALLQAKCDYFNLCRHIEEDGFTLATVMMFSLYGNPLLRMKRKDHVIDSALNNEAMPPKPVIPDEAPLNLKTFRRLVSTDKKDETNILDEIRESVNANLLSIRKMIEENLYKRLGLNPSDLSCIDSYESQTEKGYSFTYKRTDCSYDCDVRVEVDPFGQIQRVYSMK